MAIKLKDIYANVDNTDPAFPDGKFKNESAPGLLDGTPLEAVWQNDQRGFFGALLKAAGYTANGIADTPNLSQYLNALVNVTYQDFIDYAPGVEALDNGVRYECVLANGPGTLAGVRPTSDAQYWTTAARAQFDRQWPVGSVYHNASDGRNPNQIFPGGGASSWSRVEARVLIAVGTATDTRGDERTFVAGAVGGEYAHALTAAENGPHNHLMFTPEQGSLSDPVNDPSDSTTQRVSGIGNNNEYSMSRSPSDSDPTVGRTSERGTGSAHNNLPPYKAVHVWQRTA